MVIGGQGEQQIVFKSGPRKHKLENLTLSQWSIANLGILYKLVGEGKLVGQGLMDYLICLIPLRYINWCKRVV